MEFWAKTTPEGKPGISVFDHMVNVGCVAQCITEMSPGLLDRFHLRSFEVGALAALHDLGKISPGFQRKCEAWLDENGLAKVARNGCWDTGMESDHGKVSHAAVQDFLLQQGIPRDLAIYLAALLGAHHGRIKLYPNPRGIKQRIANISDSQSGIIWDEERLKYAQDIWTHFNAESTAITINNESPALWWLAGLTSVADWIGSDERFFSPERRTGNEDVASLSRTALDAIGFRQKEYIQNLSFHDLFYDVEKPEVEWVPNEMQEKTLATISKPGVYVIEAPMGMGKTEAALWAAYQLLVSGNATGIYFALPTQATSNRMHLRMREFVLRISPASNASRLIHGNSWLMQESFEFNPASNGKQEKSTEDARNGRDWFASAKRALLAPFGVGTVDQALLGVVAAKHFFVRHFALAGKVVILDEVHSYDIYTGTLIDKLITTLEALGCTVIVLSATLSGKRREQIVSRHGDESDESKRPYPLITGRKEGEQLEPVAAIPPPSRDIKVEFIAAESAVEEAITVARNGGAVLWICNTVGAAQKQYQQLTELEQDDFPLGLLHSRFPFWRREEIESEWMDRFGKNSDKRCGSILVSTQIVEQSVDLDADLMITELAPTDMLLQRLGRLWRHDRGNRPVGDVTRLYIIEEEKSLDEFRSMEPKAIIRALGGKGRVYAPFVLLRSLEVWKAHSQVSMPLQIRKLIELTYEVREKEPDSWLELSNEWFGTDAAKAMHAHRNSNIWQIAEDDTKGNQTRSNELETISLVLCRSIGKREALFIDNISAVLGGEDFLLPTAQAIHRNLVKVPEYNFVKDFIEPCPAFADYLFDKQCLGIVTDCGDVEVKGLKSGIRFVYSRERGLVIEKSS